KAENTELRRKLIDAAACARFYANGGTDSGVRAQAVLTTLVQPENVAAPRAGTRSAGTNAGSRLPGWGGMSAPPGEFGVDRKHLRHRLRRIAAEAAFGRDQEIADVFLRRRQPLARSRHAVGEVHEAERKSRIAAQL